MLRTDVYEVETIIGKKVCNRRVLYLVRWRGFSSDHDSWEPSANLGACKILIKNYNAEHITEIETQVTDCSNNKKRSHPEDASPSTTDKGPAMKKQKLSKSDLRLKLDGKEIGKADNDSPRNYEPASLGSLSGKVKNGKMKCIASKIKKLKAADLKQKGDTVVDNEITKKCRSKNDVDVLKNVKHGKGVPKYNVNKLKQSAQTPVRKINYLLKQKLSSEQSKQRIQQLRELLKLQAQKVDRNSNIDSVKLVKQKGECANKHKSCVKDKTKTKGDDQAVAATLSKDLEPETVDLTKSPSESAHSFTQTESIEISDDEDGEEVLYSLNLNPDCDLNNEGGSGSSNKRDSAGSKTSSVIEISDSAAAKSQGPSHGSSTKTKKKKGVNLMDSKQKDRLWSDKSEEPMRPVSPPPLPLFTTVKVPPGSPDNPDPSKPSGPDPVSPEASETYLADVPTSFSVTNGSSVLDEDDQPLSPGSMSYKSFLDNLPDQLLSGVKRGGKKGGKVTTNTARSGFNGLGNLVSSTTTTTSSSSSSSVSSGLGGAVERRASVRSSECAFRYKQIVVKKCFHFTQIWLNTQTPMKNALNPAVIQELISAMNSAKYDDSHLVLFSGFGPVFCSGTDLHYLVTGDRRQAARQMVERIRELTKTFISFPKPIIAAVSGAAVGLGVSLLLLCDVVYASDKASFHLPYSQLSQTPEGCSSFTLPNTLGLPSANELLFGGRKITAMEAYQLGLVSQVFWPTLMMQEVIPRAQNMAASSAKALEATKLLIRSHYRAKMEFTNETECNLLLERWLSVDCQHAIQAYIANEKNWASL